jgi:hypothetical protein
METAKSLTKEATRDPDTQVSQDEGRNDAMSYEAKTELGRRLMEIRARIVASGQPLLSWDELEGELDRRRGCHCAEDE